jgi:hypothetical protein
MLNPVSRQRLVTRFTPTKKLLIVGIGGVEGDARSPNPIHLFENYFVIVVYKFVHL